MEKVNDKLKDPVFVEYWRNNFRFDELKEKYCLRCPNFYLCWSHEGSVYHPKNIYEVCRVDEIKDVVSKIEELSSKRDTLYFGLTGSESKKLEEMFNVKTQEAKYIEDLGVTAIKSEVVKPSLLGKIKAIIGLSRSVCYCRKHRLYYKVNITPTAISQGLMYVCPRCFDEKFSEENDEN